MSSLASSDTAVVRSDKFEETQFLRDLVNLKDTQEAIQSLSLWCLKNRKKKLILFQDTLYIFIALFLFYLTGGTRTKSPVAG